MKCLCCAKEIKQDGSFEEISSKWHKLCVSKFFNTKTLPALYISDSELDISELFMRVVFSFIIGNSDMHLKNFSLIESAPGTRVFGLSPAYDLLPVNVILPEDKDETALSLNGKKRNLSRKDFLCFAGSCGIEKKTAEKITDKMCALKSKYISECRESFLPEEEKEKVIELIEDRIRRIG